MSSNKGSFKRSESSKSETKSSTYDAAAMAINHIVEITKDSTLGRSVGSSEELRGATAGNGTKPVNPKALKTKSVSVSAISVKGPFTTIKENEKKKKGSVDLQAIDQDED
ncbi:hypothetical protein QR680_012936 [Steinernema hermaphroditum]|uniref:Uncharacterized protein n=1 Tax=Steinernema hermaphroditum TaxID=289476 RepID=A0AA39I3T4_9BILA|nr:hypothetical protein QR680_012936 [Steinernema hermaphroditum]